MACPYSLRREIAFRTLTVDHSRIYTIGYALGGKVGLVAAALDNRVKAVVSVCGFDPLQHIAPGDGTEGVRH